MLTISNELKKFIEENYKGDSSPTTSEIEKIVNQFKNKYKTTYSNYEIITTFMRMVVIFLFSNRENSYDIYYKPNDIQHFIIDINDALMAEIEKQINEKGRSKIIDKHYNYINDEFEYELENGDFISCDNKRLLKIPPSVFPFEFLEKYDQLIHRTTVIENLIK